MVFSTDLGPMMISRNINTKKDRKTDFGNGYMKYMFFPELFLKTPISCSLTGVRSNITFFGGGVEDCCNCDELFKVFGEGDKGVEVEP